MKKKRKEPLSSKAHAAATRLKRTTPKLWGESEKNTYWWGAYEGWAAGYRAALRDARKRGKK